MQPPLDSLQNKSAPHSEPLPFDIEAAYAVLASLDAGDGPSLLVWGAPRGKEVVEQWEDRLCAKLLG